MYEYDGTVNHPQCFHHKRLSESEIVGIIKKLTGEPLEECAKIGLKAFCRSNPVPPKSDPFWRRGPKVTAQKTTKPPPKKRKKTTKGKAASKDSSVVDESRAGDEHSEGEDNESQDDAVEESMTQTKSALADLRKNLAEQQDAQSESERKYRLIVAELEKMKADHQKLEKKAKADQAAILKRAEEKLEAAQQELSGLKKHISNMTVAMFGKY
ncbi:hypothetical protein ZWY2020_052839 [Hordeum vulgare]|nr:hypothetical protein ZWY2020_052839 [Hordeum vulgare]